METNLNFGISLTNIHYIRDRSCWVDMVELLLYGIPLKNLYSTCIFKPIILLFNVLQNCKQAEINQDN